jgi:hypothetical protein
MGEGDDDREWRWKMLRLMTQSHNRFNFLSSILFVIYKSRCSKNTRSPLRLLQNNKGVRLQLGQ